MNVLTVIPARGGSKGVPEKNIRLFNGFPLLAHSIRAAQEARHASRILVSTQSEEIAAVAKQYGAEVPFLRPQELAGDTSRVADAVMDMLRRLEDAEGYVPTHILLLQPTNPMRTGRDIDAAIELMERRDADAVVSVCRTENLLFTKDAEDALTILNEKELASPNRQQLPFYYRLDGSMIYLIKTAVFLEYRSFFAGKLVGYEIERWRAVDIDESQDFVLGELIHAHADEISKRIHDF